MEVATAGVTVPGSIAQTPRSPSGWTSDTPTPSTSTISVRSHIAPGPAGTSPTRQIAQPSTSPT